MSTKQEPLLPGQYYHVFNKSVGGEFLFKNEGNYKYFLEKYQKYISPYAETLAYCLIPTHFHFLISPFENKPYEGSKPLVGFASEDTKTLSDKFYEGSKFRSGKSCEGSKPLVGLAEPASFDLSRKFSHLFNAYAQAYNKQNKRAGSLFKNRFKRGLITDENQLLTTIIYIHLNPSHHHIEPDFRNWKYSSFNAISGNGKTLINREKVLDLFDDKENFIFCHNKKFEFEAGLFFE